MLQTNPFLSRVLTGGYRAAAYAATELLESHPEAGIGFGADPLAAWQDWLGERLKELAATADAEEPAMFNRQVQWATAMLVARGFSTEHVRAAIESLQPVVNCELPASVRPLANEYLDRALQTFDVQTPILSTQLQHDLTDDRLATEYLLALFQGDRRRATRLILNALDDGYSAKELVTGVLLPAQVEVGRMWHADEINVAEEHFVSTTTRSLMAQLISRAAFRSSNGKTMLAAGVAGNQIDIGLQAVADFFEMDGWRVIQLGADVPIYDVVQAVEYFEADLVGLSVSQSTQLETARRTINALRSNGRVDSPKVIVGGFAFAGAGHLAKKIGADGYAADPEAAVELGGQLVFGEAEQTDGEIHG